ncbi:hypothetical protein C4J81_06550 [Deltaproteobacteria bacterium Smac51]|nr:hypothetical protein C4J81_06550 [Deltaproteobacteria bacterium Smac51]
MRKIISEIDIKTFLVPALLVVAVLTVGVVNPEGFGNLIKVAFAWISSNLGWMYDIGIACLLVFCLWAGFSKVGNIRLGGKAAKPNMSMFSWAAITFTSGMAMGVVFYGVGEGLFNFMAPPGFTGFEAGSPEAAEAALSYVFFHWGFHPYAIYTGSGLGFAFVFWNTKRSFSLSSGLYPLLGEKGEQGGWGNTVNWLCLYIMVGSLGTNMGLCALQLTAGLDYVFGSNYPHDLVHPVIIIFLAVCGITFACSGIHKAIKYVSNTNMVFFAILVVWAFLFGGTQFIINNTVTSIGQYLGMMVPQTFYLEPAKQSGWIGDWTLYYWAWWLTVAPLTGLFLIKLARGRTIRQFVLVNMFIPIGFVVIWFGTFGSSAIYQQLYNGLDIWAAIEQYGFPVSLFAYLKGLPLSGVMTMLGFLIIFLSFITQSESMIYTMAGMTSADKGETAIGEQKSPTFLKVFWGAAIAIMGYILLKSGGLKAVQQSVVMLGLPVLVILLVNAVSFIKAVNNRETYDLTLTDEERKNIIREKLQDCADDQKQAALEERLRSI